MSTNLRKQQAGFTLIGLIIAVAIIIVLFVCNDNAFFSRENDIAENKAIYEEAEKDLEEIQNQNDLRQKEIEENLEETQNQSNPRQKMMEKVKNVEQLYDERNENQ